MVKPKENWFFIVLQPGAKVHFSGFESASGNGSMGTIPIEKMAENVVWSQNAKFKCPKAESPRRKDLRRAGRPVVGYYDGAAGPL